MTGLKKREEKKKGKIQSRGRRKENRASIVISQISSANASAEKSHNKQTTNRRKKIKQKPSSIGLKLPAWYHKRISFMPQQQ